MGRVHRSITDGIRALSQPLWQVRTCLQLGIPRHIVAFGHSPGDDLLLTCVLRELGRRGFVAPWVASNHADLFIGNDDVKRVVPFDRRYLRLGRLCRARVDRLTYQERLPGEDRYSIPAQHILALLCVRAGLSGSVRLRPYLYLSESERHFGRFAHDQVVMMSSGMSARLPMLNKEWSPERFAQLAARLHRLVPVVQIGAAGDPPLPLAIDLRGRTSLRQAAAVLANSQAFVGQVGFLMHLARAVDCPAIIVFGGREAPWQSGYICNRNLYRALPCSPCWRYNSCDYERRCLTDITVDEVEASALAVLTQGRKALATQTVVLPAP